MTGAEHTISLLVMERLAVERKLATVTQQRDVAQLAAAANCRLRHEVEVLTHQNAVLQDQLTAAETVRDSAVHCQIETQQQLTTALALVARSEGVEDKQATIIRKQRQQLREIGELCKS